VTTGVIILEP
jgi:hypothetical protein